MDGATPGQAFWHLTLPLLKPAILVALIFRTAQAFMVFDHIYALTGGGPGTATESLAFLAYQAVLNDLRFGYGSALAVMIFLVGLLLALLTVRFLSRGESCEAPGYFIRLGMVLFILLSFFPFFYTLLSSLKPAAQLFEFNPPFWPRSFTWENYRAIFQDRGFQVNILNSVIVAGATSLVCVAVGSLAAYGLTRFPSGASASSWPLSSWSASFRRWPWSAPCSWGFSSSACSTPMPP